MMKAAAAASVGRVSGISSQAVNVKCLGMHLNYDASGFKYRQLLKELESHQSR